jgi:hypothetical protein
MTMKAKLRKELARLTVAEGTGELAASAAKRLVSLRKMEAAEVAADSNITYLTKLKVGEDHPFGVIEKCPQCGENGARRNSTFWRGCVVFTHTLKREQTLMRGGFQTRRGEAHYIVNGQPILKDEKPQTEKKDFYQAVPVPEATRPAKRARREVAVTFALNNRRVAFVQHVPAGVVIDLNAGRPRARKTSAEVPEWRRLAAQKAWETIRAKRAAQAVAQAVAQAA